MPTLQIGDQVVEVRRTTLTLRELADVLWPDQAGDRAYYRAYRLVGRGPLDNVSAVEGTIRVDPQQVASFVASRSGTGEISYRAALDLAAVVSTPRSPG